MNGSRFRFAVQRGQFTQRASKLSPLHRGRKTETAALKPACRFEVHFSMRAPAPADSLPAVLPVDHIASALPADDVADALPVCESVIARPPQHAAVARSPDCVTGLRGLLHAV